MRKRYIKEKCCICNKRKTKNFYDMDGGKTKPICFICKFKQLLKLLFINIDDESSLKVSNLIKSYLTFTIFVLTMGILLCAKTFSDFSDIVNVFKDKSKIIYIILFSILSFCLPNITNDPIEYYSKKSKWITIFFNVLLTFTLNLAGCIIIIKDNIELLSFKQPLIYFIIIASVLVIIIHILNNIKKINRKPLLYLTVFNLFFSFAIVLTIGIKVQFNI